METVAELIGVTRRFGPQTAVDRLDLAIPRGGVFALLGPNGAGKTTTINLLLGLLRPQEGTVTVLGRRPGDMSVRRAVGAMLQVSGVPPTLTVAELLELFRGYYPRPATAEQAVQAAGLEGLEARRYGRLSNGQKQRVLFALALCGDPELLFLDEPTVGLDVEMRRRLWAVIGGLAREGRTVVLTTHYLEEADALADRVAVLHRGRLVAQGSPAAVKALVGGRRIRCVTALDEDRLRRLPGVRSVARSGARVELTAAAAEPLLRELLATDAGVAEIEVTGIGLDDAFLSLTNGVAAGEAA
jgi:ABC-2 type transport system ATP-binding protein